MAELDEDGVRAGLAPWAAVTTAVVEFEPVTLVVDPRDAADARTTVDPRVEILEAPLEEAWMRDMGPTFVREGGGIHVDGAGAVLLTETVQLDEGRNPGWSRAQVEEELRQTLGAHSAVRLPRGLTRDFEAFSTRGQVDIAAIFASADTVPYHDQRNQQHPDTALSVEVRDILESTGRWPVVPVPNPDLLRDDRGWVDYSYINHHVINGTAILCAFTDPGDQVAAAVLADAYPARRIVLVDTRTIFSCGGGIHCITQ